MRLLHHLDGEITAMEDRIEALYEEADPKPFSDGPQSIEVYLDRALLGQFAFWWHDHDDADDVLSALREALSPYLDEELRTEDW